mmetsp:Transcript_15213/g.65148  ORF Transcript_15213/g.65148 Transcript_15213/m.65148 type:complete len:369 (+) Transcript_15213:540-1646(+)
MIPFAVSAHRTAVVTPNALAKFEKSVAANTRMMIPITPPKAPMSTALNPSPPFATLVAIQMGVSSAPVITMNAHHTCACVARRTAWSVCHASFLFVSFVALTSRASDATDAGDSRIVSRSTSREGRLSSAASSPSPSLSSLSATVTATVCKQSPRSASSDKSLPSRTFAPSSVSKPRISATEAISTSRSPIGAREGVLASPPSGRRALGAAPGMFPSPGIFIFRNANVQSASPSAPTHAVDSRNGYLRSTCAGHPDENRGDPSLSAFGSPPQGYARSAAIVGPTLDPRPYVTPNVENALALLVLSEIFAMALLVKVMTPSQKPVSARSASAQWKEDTAPSAAVSTAVTNAEKSMVVRNPSVSPRRPQA